VKALVSSQTLWFSAARTLGWGNLCLLTVVPAYWLLRATVGVPGEQPNTYLALALLYPVLFAQLVVLVSAWRSTTIPDWRWRCGQIAAGLLLPGVACLSPSAMAFCVLGPAAGWIAMGWLGLPLCTRLSPKSLPDGRYPVLCLILWACAGLVVGGATVALAPPVPPHEDPLGHLGLVTIVLTVPLLATTAACYAVAAIWMRRQKERPKSQVREAAPVTDC
jgi:hypothetical protein